MFQQIAISLLVKVLCQVLGICKGFEGCDGDKCDEMILDLKAIDRKVESPKLKASVGNPLDFLRCLDFARFLAAVRELIDVIRDARICDDDDNVITLGAAPDPAE